MLQVKSDFRLILTSPNVGWFSISFVSPMEIENQPRQVYFTSKSCRQIWWRVNQPFEYTFYTSRLR